METLTPNKFKLTTKKDILDKITEHSVGFDAKEFFTKTLKISSVDYDNETQQMPLINSYYR